MIDKIELINQEIINLDKKKNILLNEKILLEKQQHDKDFAYIKSLNWLNKIREFNFSNNNCFILGFNIVYDTNLDDQLKSFIKNNSKTPDIWSTSMIIAKDINLNHLYNEHYYLSCYDFETFCQDLLPKIDLSKIKIEENTLQASIITNLILNSRKEQ